MSQSSTKTQASTLKPVKARKSKTAPKEDAPPKKEAKPKKAKAAVPFPTDRGEVIEKYMPYVRSIAGKIKKTVAKEIDFDDLVEYGMIGLLEAADRFDPEKGANFMTFAYYRIRGAIYDGLRGMGWMSRTEYAKARFEERANEYLAEVEQAKEAGQEPPENPFETAVEDLANAVQGLAAVYITSIDAAEGLQIEDEKAGMADEKLGLDQARVLVRKTITKLSEQERELLEMYYYKEMSLQEVGEKLGLSKSWTSRLHARVIEKLHRLLEDSLG
ncbi:sigma-70 family RNA polymerase sigma factor [Myxococcota bacterium]|nr:sigma-70 family RNA polymerase sigma factor [Myxococcota bacterium]